MTIEEEIAQKIKKSLNNIENINLTNDDDIKCEYCGTVYSIKENTSCPNCGAKNTRKG